MFLQIKVFIIDAREADLSTYRKAIMVFCDLKCGKAFHDDYLWPSLADEGQLSAASVVAEPLKKAKCSAGSEQKSMARRLKMKEKGTKMPAGKTTKKDAT
jgi:hypothetical protein